MRNLAGGILDTLFPQTCAACAAWIPSGEPLCDSCRAEIDALSTITGCPRCGRSTPAVSIHERRCVRCRSEAHWNIAEIVRVGPYDGPLRPLVIDVKYHGRAAAAECAGQRLAEALRRCPWLSELHALVPVPMHRLRRLQRPCNHTLMLAQALGRALRLPVWRVASRVRYAPSQMQMTSRMQRFDNVRQCFAVRGARRRARLSGRTVCIVENVLTSGATLCELSKALRAGGAKKIYAAIVARAALGRDGQALSAALVQECGEPEEF